LQPSRLISVIWSNYFFVVQIMKFIQPTMALLRKMLRGQEPHLAPLVIGEGSLLMRSVGFGFDQMT